MKKILSLFIAVQLTLAPSCLQAGLADWVSGILPSKFRLSQEYCDEFEYMRRKATTNTTPIIFYKSSSPGTLGVTRNFGLGSSWLSIVGFNEDLLKSDCTPADTTHTIAHELTHVEHNHGGNQNAIVMATLGTLMGIRTTQATLGEEALNKTFVDMAVTAAHTVFLYAITRNFFTGASTMKKHEAEAEQGAIEKMTTLGYCKALQENHNESGVDVLPLYFRPKGDVYPTIAQYQKWFDQNLKRCQGLDPSQRPDSPNITRNGS